MTTKKKPINALHRKWGFGGIWPGLPEPGASYKGGGIFDKFLANCKLDPKVLHRISKAYEAEIEADRFQRFSEPLDLKRFDGPLCPPNCPHCIKLQQQMVEAEIRILKTELAKASKKENADGTPEAESGD